MLSDSGSGDASPSEPIVITREDIAAVEAAAAPRRGFGSALKGAIIPALIGGLLAGIVLSNTGVADGWGGGVLVGLIILGATSLILYKWVLKSETLSPTGMTTSGLGGARTPEMMPRIVIRADELLPATPSRIDMPVSAASVEPVAEPVAVEDDAVCPYCGEQLSLRPTQTCRHCHTPHHRDCWSQNEGCTTLGCRSSR